MNDKTTKHKVKEPEMRAEYDFSGGVRGKYYKRVMEGSGVVLLDSDVAKAFPDSASVNKALRSVLKARRARRPATRTSRAR